MKPFENSFFWMKITKLMKKKTLLQVNMMVHLVPVFINHHATRISHSLLTLKSLVGGKFDLLLPLPVIFPKIYLPERGWNCGFFVTINVIISHFFPENFIEIPEVVQGYEYFFINVNYFHQFFGFFWHFLVTKKLMT